MGVNTDNAPSRGARVQTFNPVTQQWEDVLSTSFLASPASATITVNVTGVIAATINSAITVSSILVPVSISSISVPVSISSIAIPITVSSIQVPVSVSSIAIPITVSSIQNTVNVSATTLPLPAGAATQSTLLAIALTLTDINDGVPNSLGQQVMASSMPVTIASNQTGIPVTIASAITVSAITVPITISSIQSVISANISNIPTISSIQVPLTISSIQNVISANISNIPTISSIQVPITISSIQLAITVSSITNQISANVSAAVLDSISGHQSSTAATVASVAATSASVTLLALNNSRKGAIFYLNATAGNCFLKLGSNPTSASFTQKMAFGDTVVLDGVPVHQGIVTGVWDSANGTMLVTELT